MLFRRATSLSLSLFHEQNPKGGVKGNGRRRNLFPTVRVRDPLTERLSVSAASGRGNSDLGFGIFPWGF